MAIYHLNVRGISPLRGASAIASAAYQSGERLRDLATGEICRYARQERVAETGIVLPDAAPAWAHDRESLWNRAAEAWAAGNSSRLVARRIVVALPRELSYERMRECIENLCKTFAADGHACDWAIHDVDSGNPHAHILISGLQLGKSGFIQPKAQKTLTRYICRRDGEERQISSAEWKAAKKDGWQKIFRYRMQDGSEARLTQSEAAKLGLGNEDRKSKTAVAIVTKADGESNLEDAKSDLVALRASWAEIANAALDEQYKADSTPEPLREHIDHRSNADREIESVATIHEGPSVTAMERHAIDAGEPVAATRVREQNQKIHFHNYMLAKLRTQIVHLVARVAEARSRAAARVRAKAARARSFFRGVPSAIYAPAAIEISSGIPASAVRIQEQRPQPPVADAVRILVEAAGEMARAGAVSAKTASASLKDGSTDMRMLDMTLSSLRSDIKTAKLAAEEAARQSAAEAAKAAAKKTAVYLSAENHKRLMELLGSEPDAGAKPAAQRKAEASKPIARPSQADHQEATQAAEDRQKFADAQNAEQARQQQITRQKAAEHAKLDIKLQTAPQPSARPKPVEARSTAAAAVPQKAEETRQYQRVSETSTRATEKRRQEAPEASEKAAAAQKAEQARQERIVRQKAAQKAAEAARRAQAEAAAWAAEEYRRTQEALQQRDENENQDQDYWEEPER